MGDGGGQTRCHVVVVEQADGGWQYTLQGWSLLLIFLQYLELMNMLLGVSQVRAVAIIKPHLQYQFGVFAQRTTV